jgi:hypothetical protein
MLEVFRKTLTGREVEEVVESWRAPKERSETRLFQKQDEPDAAFAHCSECDKHTDTL